MRKSCLFTAAVFLGAKGKDSVFFKGLATGSLTTLPLEYMGNTTTGTKRKLLRDAFEGDPRPVPSLDVATQRLLSACFLFYLCTRSGLQGCYTVRVFQLRLATFPRLAAGLRWRV